MSDVVISARNVSKTYRIWQSPTGRLSNLILDGVASLVPGDAGAGLRRRSAKGYRNFSALSGISFDVRKGESVGIIGRNGSGKSTLLQIVTGTLQPTSGSVFVNGRVAALLELGSGFNPEFTGRENVYLNGAVLGFTRAEIDDRFDAIAAFADIGDFIDQPVKTYSSGMMVRLAFAVAVSVEPEILIVDEALSVGDVFFQQKCFSRVREMLGRGVSLLFVSHDTAAVQNLCDRALLLVQGEKRYEGPPEEAVSRYYAISVPAADAAFSGAAAHAGTAQRGEWLALLERYDIRAEARSEHGARDLVVEQVAIFDSARRPARNFRVGETMHIVALLRAKRNLGGTSAGLHFYDRMNNLVFAAGTRQLQVPFGDFSRDETRLVEFQLQLNVHPGEYTFSVGCSQVAQEGPNHGYAQHRLEGLGPITILPSPGPNGTWPFYGQANLPMEITIHG